MPAHPDHQADGSGRGQTGGQVQERPPYTPNPNYLTARGATGSASGAPAGGGASNDFRTSASPNQSAVAGQEQMDPRVVQAYMQGLQQNPEGSQQVDIQQKAIPGGSTVTTQPTFRTGM